MSGKILSMAKSIGISVSKEITSKEIKTKLLSICKLDNFSIWILSGNHCQYDLKI